MDQSNDRYLDILPTGLEFENSIIGIYLKFGPCILGFHRRVNTEIRFSSTFGFLDSNDFDIRPHLRRALLQKVLIGHSGDEIPHNFGRRMLPQIIRSHIL